MGAPVINADGIPTTEDLLSKQGGMCASCKCKGDNIVWHLDHIYPLTPREGKKQGWHGPDNLQVLCRSCNTRKHNKDPFDWAFENGRLLEEKAEYVV